MSQQTIKLLHVEDNVADRLLMARLLGQMKEYDFTIVRAATEITAVAELNKGGVDFVILDYRLPLGDGLGCLRKLRQIDSAVPIIVISGVTTPEIGAECLQSGADDYLSKQDLTAEKLAGSVRKAMTRAHSWPTIRSHLLPLCKSFLGSLDPEFFRALDDLEQALRQSGITSDQVPSLFDSVAGELLQGQKGEQRTLMLMIRPLVLEVVERLAAKPTPPARPSSGSRTGT
jgi:CheY-like chemotaxis protein